jgi:uncharacterized protein YndB with AHSA1/START domain
MKIVAILLGIAALAIVIVLVMAARRPDSFALQRSVVIEAPAERVFPLIVDLRRHQSWSPFDAPDGKTRKVYTGAASGAGAVYEWDGNGRSGSGRLSITDAQAASRAVMRLDMLKPFKASNEVVFTLVPEGGATRVTWSMRGRTPFVARIVHVFLDMDRMVGGDFERGLAALKRLSEAPQIS